MLWTLCVIFMALLFGCWCLLSGIRQVAVDPTVPEAMIDRRLTAGKYSIVGVLALTLGIVLVAFETNQTGLFLLLLLLLPIVPPTIRHCVTRLRTRRHRQTLLAELPDSLTQMASSMQAGATLATAMRWYIEESSGPLAQELFIVQHEHRLGVALEDALHRLGTRVALREMELVVCAVLVARETGGNLAGVLSQLSDSVGQQLEIKAKISSLTAQGVMQGWIVSLLPVLVGAALFVLDPVAIKPLFSGLLGWLCLSVIAILEISGAVMIWRIVHIDV